MGFIEASRSRIDALLEKVNLSIDRLREYRTTLISDPVTKLQCSPTSDGSGAAILAAP